MAKEKERREFPKSANTFIDKGVTIEAKMLQGAESVRIDGHYIGDIELDSYLQVGETGLVEGNMQVSYALISGEVKGNITCRATIQLSSTSTVYGNITTNRIVMDEGSKFYGYCHTRDPINKPAGDVPEVVVV